MLKMIFIIVLYMSQNTCGVVEVFSLFMYTVLKGIVMNCKNEAKHWNSSIIRKAPTDTRGLDMGSTFRKEEAKQT